MNKTQINFVWLKKKIQSFISYFVTLIYNLLFSRFVSIWAYQGMIALLSPKIKSIKSILDVGVGTGLPLSYVIGQFNTSARVLGVDIDKNYVVEAKKLFIRHPNVEIKQQDFYKLQTDRKYDLIILGFSFMLMPSPQKALMKAKSMLSQNGRIVFLLTIHKQKNKFKELLKPLIKYLTTIDFGKMTYEQDFYNIISTYNLEIENKMKLGQALFSKQILFKLWNVWVFQTKVLKTSRDE